jgi:hypothetical protein
MLNPVISPELVKAELYERSKQIEALQLLNHAAAASPKKSLLKRIAGKVNSLRAEISTRSPEVVSLAEQQ